MLEFKPIHAIVTNPKNSLFKSGRNAKAECKVILCNNSENCKLYAEGKCLKLGMFPEYCPYGKTNVTTGFTRNAKCYSTWINEKTTEYKDVLNILKSSTNIMTSVGEYIFLPYAHIDMNKEVPFLRHSHFLHSGIRLLKKEDFNINSITNIVNFRPYASMGGEITSYQTEVVPLFVKHLSEVFPNLYSKLINKIPELKYN